MPTPTQDQNAPLSTPLTRRHLREAERAELATRRHRGRRSTFTAAPRAGSVHSEPLPLTASTTAIGSSPVTASAPVIGTTPITVSAPAVGFAPTTAPAPVIGVAPVTAAAAVARERSSFSRTARRSATQSFASKGLTVLTMGFVATVTVATSLPANALYSPEETIAAPVASATYAAAGMAGAQSVTVPDAKMETIAHDTYAVEAYQEVQVAQGDGVGTFANDPNGTIQWPFSTAVPISGTFGYRIAPCSNGCSSDHKGVDFAPGMGAPIQAIADGVVRYAESSDYGLGVHVIIDHMIDGHLVTSVYGHMQFGSLKVTEGQTVTVGQQIGGVGSTGASTGPHLHLEIHLEDGTAIDPYAWLKAHAN
ncbi:M23 family metallopeptidase [Planctomonas deserti]|uniref:M23 family metallopeptidase n=1 Tax=Planctomonas deserti TaxID=2144185 RepID=UPI000D35D234|nr:M23 family metallopeptidase [Planctomonas deserti]